MRVTGDAFASTTPKPIIKRVSKLLTASFSGYGVQDSVDNDGDDGRHFRIICMKFCALLFLIILYEKCMFKRNFMIVF